MTAKANNNTAAAPAHIETDVLVIGAGGAGMYAALEAAKAGAAVVLADRSLIGRGGATVMAQMTVAAALSEQTPDHWEHHLADTLAAGPRPVRRAVGRLLCEDGPHRLREMDGWKVGWAREDGHIKQAQAPGHDRPRCAYVDFLSTGPAVSRTLRAQLNLSSGIRRIGELVIVDIALHDGQHCKHPESRHKLASLEIRRHNPYIPNSRHLCKGNDIQDYVSDKGLELWVGEIQAPTFA